MCVRKELGFLWPPEDKYEVLMLLGILVLLGIVTGTILDAAV